MIALSSGLSYIDLRFRGVPRVIATAVLHGTGGVALIDPGPTSTLPVLSAELERSGITFADLTTLLLTHIHLDHAGAAGTLVHDNPRLRVVVHQNGAPHMIDPTKLISSVTRLYGDAMDRLWGEFRPVPVDAIDVLAGGEHIGVAGRDLEVAFTPGHASHHVSYFDRAAGVAFVGDAAGIRLLSAGYVLPPTPPPDIDLEAWRDSLRRIDAWGADTLFLTHFGPSAPAGAHLRELADHLDVTAGLVASSLAQEEEKDDAAREAWFASELRRELRRHMSEADAQTYETAGPFNLNWRGLARYWRKRATPIR